MNPSTLPESSSDDLQFNTADAPKTTPGARSSELCVACQQPIAGSYFAVHDQMLCPTCCAQFNAPPAGTALGRLIKATLLGLAAGLIGAVIWFVIRRAVHLEIGLVAILVGFLVGKAVRIGSGHQGGLGYQILAVALTYGCIAANYMPDAVDAVLQVAQERHDEKAAPQGEPAAAANAPLELNATQWGVVLGLSYVLALAAPVAAGAENIIGLLIIGFALWEAWKFTAKRKLPITGPYQLRPSVA